MAGDWLKVEKGLGKKPKVLRIARRLGLDRRVVAMSLVELWSWVDDVSVDGRVDADVDAEWQHHRTPEKRREDEVPPPPCPPPRISKEEEEEGSQEWEFWIDASELADPPAIAARCVAAGAADEDDRAEVERLAAYASAHGDRPAGLFRARLRRREWPPADWRPEPARAVRQSAPAPDRLIERTLGPEAVRDRELDAIDDRLSPEESARLARDARRRLGDRTASSAEMPQEREFSGRHGGEGGPEKEGAERAHKGSQRDGGDGHNEILW